VKNPKEYDFSKQNKPKKSDSTIEVKFSTLDIEGVLKIIDSVKFKNCLLYGIGPSKSFGCGLMLIKRF
jgi:CRISPR system Cascade subunit CasE